MDHVSMEESVSNVAVRCTSMKHHCTEAHTNNANDSFNHTIFILTVVWRELMFHPLFQAVINKEFRSIDHVVIATNVGNFTEGVPIFQKAFQFDIFLECLVFRLEDVDMAHPTVIIYNYLKSRASICKRDVHVDAIVHLCCSRPVFMQWLLFKRGSVTGSTVGVVAGFEAKHLSHSGEIHMAKGQVSFHQLFCKISARGGDTTDREAKERGIVCRIVRDGVNGFNGW